MDLIDPGAEFSPSLKFMPLDYPHNPEIAVQSNLNHFLKIIYNIWLNVCGHLTIAPM